MVAIMILVVIPRVIVMEMVASNRLLSLSHDLFLTLYFSLCVCSKEFFLFERFPLLLIIELLHNYFYNYLNHSHLLLSGSCNNHSRFPFSFPSFFEFSGVNTGKSNFERNPIHNVLTTIFLYTSRTSFISSMAIPLSTNQNP